MTLKQEPPPEKLCPGCGDPMWLVTIPGFGKLLNCSGCRSTMSGTKLYAWRPQTAAAVQAETDLTAQGETRRRSNKLCPECGEPMWALQEPGYGTRHQCEDCRLTVLFGGAIARWKSADLS